MNKLKKCLFSIFVFSGYYSFAQPAVVIQKMDSLYQACLNKGDNMVGCSYTYYNQMDSMLNVVYKMLRVRYDTNGRIKLRTEELDWIKKRDAYFSSLKTKDYGSEGNDGEMMMEDNKALYVRKRAIELLNRLIY